MLWPPISRRSILFLLALWISCCSATAQREEFHPLEDDEAFPAEWGFDRDALEELAGEVQGFVDGGRIVGAELQVIAGRRTVLHRAFGYKDREDGAAMELHTVFNVRSMTKPIVGTVAQILIDNERLSPEEPVAGILPEFRTGRCGEITIAQLLTHRSGLRWTGCADAESLREMARCAARLGPTQFIPGTDFLYSNVGSNVLAAALVEVGGAPLEKLVTDYVLRPLQMFETFSLASADVESLSRCASQYAIAEDGTLERVWCPADGPQLPFLQGAHGLGSTTADYARFLTLWLDGGSLGTRRVLHSGAVERGLRPFSSTELPTTFPGRNVYYGQHWVLRTIGKSGEVESFGHSGSDGTYAWAWPKHDLMVLYFTQVTNSTTGIELEVEIDRLLLASDSSESDDANAAYAGFYRQVPGGLVRVVTVASEGRLELDVVGTGTFVLEPTDDPLRWEIPGRPGFDVGFHRDEAGQITHLVPPEITGESPLPRLVPDPSLPSVDELMTLRLGVDGSGAPKSLGIFRMSGSFWKDGEKQWRDTLYSDGDLRSREEVHRSKRGPSVTICNGERACSISSGGRRKLLSGDRRIQAITGRLAVLVGDWRRYYEEVSVLARVDRDGREHYLVQAIPTEAAPTYYLVELSSGRVVESHISVDMPFGSMGKISTYSDYRDTEGVSIPFTWEGHFASEQMGSWKLRYEEIEIHLAPDGDLFGIEE
jgi:CubicO group peptidase (beta-lactamase class C family)